MEENLYFEQYGDLKFAVYKISNEVEVDDFSLEIIRRNKVSGLLGCTIIQNNNDKIIKYNIEKMISLSDILKESISENNMVELLINIIQTLNSLEDYMLFQNQVILNTGFIFNDFELGKIGLIYLPIESNKIKSKNFTRFLKEVVLDMKISNQPDCSFFNKIVGFLNENRDASIKSIGEFLSDLKRKQLIEVDDEYTDINDYSVFEIQDDSIRSQPSTFISNDFLHNENYDFQNLTESTQITNIQKNKKSSIFSFFYKKNKKQKKKIDKELSSFHSFLNQSIPIQQNSPQFSNINSSTQNSNNSLHSIQNDGTTMLNLDIASGTTVLNYANQPYILRKKSGERFYISNEKCTIGTDKKVSTFFISNNSSISRIHATFTRKKGVVFIHDNRSTNGTYVNSQKVIKGSKKKLTHGDCITFSNEDFEFKTY